MEAQPGAGRAVAQCRRQPDRGLVIGQRQQGGRGCRMQTLRRRDATGERPGMMDFINRMKFDAWDKLKGTPTDGAMTQYIALVDRLLGR